MQEKQTINVVNSMTISKRNIVQREFEKLCRENFVSTWLTNAIQKAREIFLWNFQVGQQAHSYFLGVST
jgi:hypothetical protein